MYWRVLKHSFTQTLIRLLWLFGLTQCGPLRTNLVFEQSAPVVVCTLKAIFLSQTNPSRSRGVVLLIAATLLLLAFDFDDVRQETNDDHHPEGTHHGIFSHIFFLVISWFNVADHKAGILLLIVALLLQVAFDHSVTHKVLVNDIGGNKRLRAISTCMSTLILLPWAIFNIFTNVIHSFGTLKF